MNTALAIEELRVVRERHDRAMPDVRVDIQTATAVAPEGNEFLRRDVVARQRQWDDEGPTFKRVKELAPVRMIIGAPDQGAFPCPARPGRGRLLGPVAPAE